MTPQESCSHPVTRRFSWWAYNYKTDKHDILCVGCCECGKILQGEAAFYNKTEDR